MKMSKKINLVLVSVLAILFMGGCSKKSDVGFDDTKVTEKAAPASGSQVEKKDSTGFGADKSVAEDSSDVSNKGTTTDSTVESVAKKDGEPSYINVVDSEIDGQTISLKSIHFAFDKFNLTDKMRVITKENYKIIDSVIAKKPSVKIKLEGNCDEWGTDEYNYALGLKRAKTVKDALVSDGIDSSKIVLVSFGESNPLCTEKSENCWKKNRRTDYKLLP